MRHKRTDRGFTIIELLSVIAIIAILAGLLMPVMSRVRLQSRITKTDALVNSLAAAAESYRLDWGLYPDVSGMTLAPAAPTTNEARASCRILYFCLTTPFRKNVAVSTPTGASAASITPSKTYGPYIELKGEDLDRSSGTPWIKDAFHNPLAYNYNNDFDPSTTPPVCNPDSFDLWSFGSDGTTGTSDDLGNW